MPFFVHEIAFLALLLVKVKSVRVTKVEVMSPCVYCILLIQVSEIGKMFYYPRCMSVRNFLARKSALNLKPLPMEKVASYSY